MKKNNRFLKWLSSSAGLQVFSVFLAIIAWIFVNSGQIIQQKHSLRLEYVQLPKGMAFQRTPLKEVKIVLKGSLYRLKSIHPEDLVYLVDLSNVHAGPHRVEIELDSLRLPLDIEAVNVAPRSFIVNFEEVFVRDVPVRPVFSGSLKSGFTVSQVRVTPEIVTVTGPRSVISKIDRIDVDVPLSDKDASFSTTVKPRPSFPDTQTVESVLVEVEVGAITNNRQLQKVPVVVEGGPPGVKVSPSSGTVIVEGSQKDISSLEGTAKIVVSAEGLKQGRYRIRGRVSAKDSVKVVSIDPLYFIVEVGR